MTNDTYEEILVAYQKAINQIDDYFEYANESKKDRVRVHSILFRLTDKLREIHSAKPSKTT